VAQPTYILALNRYLASIADWNSHDTTGSRG
jgi:hypothetical protein